MLPKRSRLTAAEVRATLKGGKSLREGAVSVKYSPAKNTKAAVVVSTKVAGSAVKRNALRRAGYQTLKGLLPKGLHAVFFIHTQQFDPRALTHLCSKLS